jgi:hypothetical protein
MERVRALFRASGRVSRRLAEGIPSSFVALLAAAVLVAILYTVASRDPSEPRGYAELTMTRNGCAVDVKLTVNATVCTQEGPRTFRVTFTKSLTGSTVVASRGSCCAGGIGATIDTDRSVVVAVTRPVRRPIRASLFVP